MSVILRKLRGSRFGKAGMVAGGLVAGLVALDLIGFVATVYYGPQLVDAAEAEGVAELLGQ